MLLEMDYAGLKQVISGGQDGVDRGAIEAAHSAGVRTGGWAPRGWRTARGQDVTLRDKFGLLEHQAPGYPPRTEENVKLGDGTLIIASALSSPGTALTRKFIKKWGKPSHIVQVPTGECGEEIADWIAANSIEVLNVAGNHLRPEYHHNTARSIVSDVLSVLSTRGLLQVSKKVE